MKTFYMMCGLSRAGKTTYAQKLAEETGAVLVCRDDELYFNQSMGFFAAELIAQQKVHELLKNGKSVIYDSMALVPGERQMILNRCRTQDCKTVCVFVNTPREVIEQRGGRIPYEALIPPTDNEGFDEIIVINN